uniref:Uncharacterized protein n=1 Tax=Rhizobium meliloti TaxID=382 RepID=A0A0D4DCA9_RHIML|nr:hypothetical protein [Sinorhizobium meliloti]
MASLENGIVPDIPANTAFERRSSFQKIVSPLNFDRRIIARVGRLQHSIPSSGALLFGRAGQDFNTALSGRLHLPPGRAVAWNEHPWIGNQCVEVRFAEQAGRSRRR